MARAQTNTAVPATSIHPSSQKFQDLMDSGTIAVYTDDMVDPDLSPEPGSEIESGPGSEQQDEQHSPDDSTGPGSVKAEAEQGDENTALSSSTIPTPVQKRRRVTRACDECRRKKIKCDGKQPCTHCSVYSYGEDMSSIWSRRNLR